jgi:hypothetical protein
MILILLVAFSLVFLCVAVLIVPRFLPDDFCTVNDEVYRFIQAEVHNWINYFQSSKDDMPLSFRVPVSSGQEYLVLATLWEDETDPPILFIPTRALLRNIYGVKGYAYSPNGPVVPDNRYDVVTLSEGIHCYSM